MTQPSFLDVLDLEEIDLDLYRSRLLVSQDSALYGGQVAAQALLAAGRTVEPGRLPHSLHGYFLRAGDASRPTVLRVERDRDGRSFSARRVVALQGGKVIFNMSASFHVADAGPDRTAEPPVAMPDPTTLKPFDAPYLLSFEVLTVPGPYEDLLLPPRTLVRSTIPLPDDRLVHACALTYVSDGSSGLGAFPSDDAMTGPSLDHAVWFHRDVRMDDWTLTELVGRSVAGGRGWYTGSVHGADGTLVASLAQEALFRSR
jgi:acyl-CoA thioesterase-2